MALTKRRVDFTAALFPFVLIPGDLEKERRPCWTHKVIILCTHTASIPGKETGEELELHKKNFEFIAVIKPTEQ